MSDIKLKTLQEDAEDSVTHDDEIAAYKQGYADAARPTLDREAVKDALEPYFDDDDDNLRDNAVEAILSSHSPEAIADREAEKRERNAYIEAQARALCELTHPNGVAWESLFEETREGYREAIRSGRVTIGPKEGNQ